MNKPNWYPDEQNSAGKEHLDAEYVPRYDRKADTDPSEDIALLCRYGLNETHTVVDMGAGTGTFALAVAPYCRHVFAVDVSPVMLGYLLPKAVERGIHNMTCLQEGFLGYTHQGDPADFVYSRHALHHLPDIWKAVALSRIASFLRVEGVLYLADLLFSCDLSELTSVVNEWLAGASRDSGRGWTREELETHLREEHSTFTWLLEPMLARAGFDIVQAQHSASRVRSSYVCIKHP
jgi:ubiquinone/menaquinone biosynthesis C-methylase UbiE